MAADITPIPARRPVTELTDRELLEEMTMHLRRIDGHLSGLEPLIGQFRVAGLLGISRAARRASKEGSE